jgi:hypothetical protein
MVDTRHGIVEDFMTWTFKLLIHYQILVFFFFFACFCYWGWVPISFLLRYFKNKKKFKKKFQVYLEGNLYL